MTSRADLTGRRLLRHALGAVRGSVAIALAAGVAWQAVAVAVPYVVGRAVDDGVLTGDVTALLVWAGLLLGLGVVRWAGDWYRHWWVDPAACAPRCGCAPGCWPGSSTSTTRPPGGSAPGS